VANQSISLPVRTFLKVIFVSFLTRIVRVINEFQNKGEHMYVN